MFTSPDNRRRLILEFVRRHVELHGYSPSVREIGAATGLKSTRAVKYHLDALVNAGSLERVPGRARALSAPARPFALPLVGRVAAGSPVLAVENVESYLAFSRFEGCFLLRVQGESMRDAGIFDGDLVIVSERAEARDGDVVAARIGDEATVKYFRPGAGRVVLEPANPDFPPLAVDPGREDFALVGVVVGLLRTYPPGRKNGS
ncbi:MAG: transcriptional repressor LexA [bacterium]